ncbi:hypothetical protein [Flavobacterium pedocola]
MLKNLFKKIFKREASENSGMFLVATLNDKIMPIDGGNIYEDPLDDYLKINNYGEVTGGGTMQLETGEIEFCDIEIFINSDKFDTEIVNKIIDKLEELGAPKGSSLLIEKTKETFSFGKKEGLAIYLDGINLSDEVYKNSDSEAIALEIKRLADIDTDIIRYWQGNTETALYFYGESFEKIKESIEDFVKTNPECENCRIEKIA